jgi:ribosomal protein S4
MKKSLNIYKPVYKVFLGLKENVQNRKKILGFKKKKWINSILVKNLKKNNNRKFGLFDHSIYYRPKFGSFFSKSFKLNLLIKKKISVFYGYLTLKSLKSIKKKVTKVFKSQNLSKKFCKLEQYYLKYLESRLDKVLYNSYLVTSIRESNNMINQGYVLVNAKKITSTSYAVKKGDIISFTTSALPLIENNLIKYLVSPVNRTIPSYLEINYKTFHIIVFSDINEEKFSNVSSFKLNFKKLDKFLL